MEEPKKIVLIIEDDATLQMVYRQKFLENGYDVYSALTGNQGLTYAKEHTPQIILLDIMLPEGMNGFDVMEQIKQDTNLTHVPVIILTNLDSEKDTALSMGAADYIVKANTSIDELLQKVNKLLA